MKRQDFYFDIPAYLIAQYPLLERTSSRLLSYSCKTEAYAHHQFKDIIHLLSAGDLLVLNNSKVIPARFFGQKESGGKLEFLLERMHSPCSFWSHIKASKAPKPGTFISVGGEWRIEVIEKKEDLYLCHVNGLVDDLLAEKGHIPLPPYIQRPDETLDTTRYQTVYAEHKGSVAAPTAGLHFDEALLSCLREKGVELAYTTLHVGAGTFRPVRCDDIQEHKMHAEYFTVNEALCEAVRHTQARGGRVIAVGTTALRALESAVRDARLEPCSRETSIFIYPGFQFHVCDGLITNFHLSESTLLMLVAAFIGYEAAMKLYRIAIAEEYRFFSYGDASLLLRKE